MSKIDELIRERRDGHEDPDNIFMVMVLGNQHRSLITNAVIAAERVYATTFVCVCVCVCVFVY